MSALEGIFHLKFVRIITFVQNKNDHLTHYGVVSQISEKHRKVSVREWITLFDEWMMGGRDGQATPLYSPPPIRTPPPPMDMYGWDTLGLMKMLSPNDCPLLAEVDSLGPEKKMLLKRGHWGRGSASPINKSGFGHC